MIRRTSYALGTAMALMLVCALPPMRSIIESHATVTLANVSAGVMRAVGVSVRAHDASLYGSAQSLRVQAGDTLWFVACAVVAFASFWPASPKRRVLLVLGAFVATRVLAVLRVCILFALDGHAVAWWACTLGIGALLFVAWRQWLRAHDAA